MSTEQKACIDNSKEIWASPDDMKSVRAALYPDGAIGITVHGMGIVMPIEKWFRAADALSQTIPRTDGNTITVSRMTLEWIAKKCADKRNPQVAFVVSKLLAGEALSALRGMADDAQTIPRTTDEGMRDKLGGPITDDTLKEWLEQAVREGDEKNGYVGPEWRYGDQEPLAAEAALAAMRRVSKTDEGRNAVIEECARAAHAKRSECDEAFYETNGSIYTEAYLDGISAAYDAIRALTTGGK